MQIGLVFPFFFVAFVSSALANGSKTIGIEFSFQCNIKQSYQVWWDVCEDDFWSKKCGNEVNVACYGGPGKICKSYAEISDSLEEPGSFEILARLRHTCSSYKAELKNNFPRIADGPFIDVSREGPEHETLIYTLVLDDYAF